MTRMRKLTVFILLLALLSACAMRAAVAADEAQTYAYLPDHSVYFYDVSDSYAWAHREVDALALAGVVQGQGDYLYHPGEAITRADFIVMLDRAYGLSAAVAGGLLESKGNFQDVPTDAYYAKAVAAAKAWGVATGAHNLFRPSQRMTRQDAMVFLKRTLDCAGITLQKGEMDAFSDASQFASYAADAAALLVGANIIGGNNGKLMPRNDVTRAEMAVMIYRAQHLQVEDTGVYYRKRGDIVNVCVGAQVYTDVMIENYDPSRRYADLMRYETLRTAEGITYITLKENQQINQKLTINGTELTFTANGETKTLPMAENCIAIDITHYHKMSSLRPTDSTYQYCYPSINEKGEVTEIYYAEA